MVVAVVLSLINLLRRFAPSHQARLWGNATSGKTVSVSLNGGPATPSAKVAADEQWAVDLPPQPAGSGHTITVTDGTTTLKLVDIAFGDVYLCTGPF